MFGGWKRNKKRRRVRLAPNPAIRRSHSAIINDIENKIRCQ